MNNKELKEKYDAIFKQFGEPLGIKSYEQYARLKMSLPNDKRIRNFDSKIKEFLDPHGKKNDEFDAKIDEINKTVGLKKENKIKDSKSFFELGNLLYPELNKTNVDTENTISQPLPQPSSDENVEDEDIENDEIDGEKNTNVKEGFLKESLKIIHDFGKKALWTIAIFSLAVPVGVLVWGLLLQASAGSILGLSSLFFAVGLGAVAVNVAIHKDYRDKFLNQLKKIGKKLGISKDDVEKVTNHVSENTPTQPLPTNEEEDIDLRLFRPADFNTFGAREQDGVEENEDIEINDQPLPTDDEEDIDDGYGFRANEQNGYDYEDGNVNNHPSATSDKDNVAKASKSASTNRGKSKPKTQRTTVNTGKINAKIKEIRSKFESFKEDGNIELARKYEILLNDLLKYKEELIVAKKAQQAAYEKHDSKELRKSEMMINHLRGNKVRLDEIEQDLISNEEDYRSGKSR